MPPNAGRVQPLTRWRAQSHAGDLGRRGLLGSFEPEKLFHEYDPEHVPKPIAFGNYKENPETWFFLADFHDMVEEQPDIKTFVSIVANWHKKSMGKSPNGKWGFHVETGLPFVQHDNPYQDTWETLFTQMMRQMIIEEDVIHGQNDDLDELKKHLFEKVIPRLLRPLETGGRSITPCLIHTDLWSGNMNPDVDTDKLMVYDSRGMWEIMNATSARGRSGE
jgi:protein-ribulosamine 3-kinase